MSSFSAPAGAPSQIGASKTLRERYFRLCSCFVRGTVLGWYPWLASPQPSDARRRPPSPSPPRRRAALPDAAGGRCPQRRRRVRPRSISMRRRTARWRSTPSVAGAGARSRTRPAATSRWPGPLRRRLAEFRGTAAVQDHGDPRFHPQDHHPQRFTGYFLRPVDQSLSRLRARLHLLLRAADPCLSGPVAGARFRIKAVRQARRTEAARARIVGARLRAAHHRHRHQHRSLSADRARASDHAPHPGSARSLRPSGRHRDEIGAGPARPRHARPHGAAQSGQGRPVGHDARSSPRARDGAARGDACATARGAAPTDRGRRTGVGDGGAGDPGAQ